MDYKEKYEQALEVAQGFYNNSTAMTKKGLEDIFPELKEDEDEKIKKIVKDFVENYLFWEKNNLTKEKALAWLEKQGEQILANSAKTCKVEQKPAESINNVYPETLDKAIDLYYYSYGNGNGYFKNLSFEKFKDIVKSFVSDYGKQASAWSKEDEKQLQHTIAAIQWYAGGIDIIDWLKSLKDRYTWKPSDEQMNALKSQLPLIKCKGFRVQTVLESLYNDLKKLREE